MPDVFKVQLPAYQLEVSTHFGELGSLGDHTAILCGGKGEIRLDLEET